MYQTLDCNVDCPWSDWHIYSNAKLTHLLYKAVFHFWSQSFEKIGKNSMHFTPQKGVVSGIFFFLPNQEIVISSKQNKQWWWVTMHNQKHARDEQLAVVSIVFVKVAKALFILQRRKKIKGMKLWEMNMGLNPPIILAPPIFHLQLIFPICFFRKFSQVRILWSTIS